MAIFRNWEKSTASYQFVTIVVSVAGFTDAFVYGMSLPILPVLLERRISVKPADVQFWTSVVIATFGGLFLITPPIAGLISDRSASKRLPFIAGLVVMAASSVLFFLAKTLPPLLIGRALQAVSCAFCFACGFTLISNSAPPGKKGIAMGYVTLGTAMGDLVGPVLGGFIYQYGGHNAMFAVVVAIIVVDIILRLLVRDETVPELGEEDVPVSAQPIQSYGTRGEPVVGTQAQTSNKQTRSTTFESRLENAPSNEARKRGSGARILLTNPRIWATFWAMLAVAVIRTSYASVLTLFVRDRFGWSSSISGLIFFVFLSPTLFSPALGHLAERDGARKISIVTFILLALSTTALAFATTNTLFTKIAFVALILCIGVNMAFGRPAHNIAIIDIVDDVSSQGFDSVIGFAFSFSMSGWALGMVLGPLLATVVEPKFGWQGICGANAILSIFTSVIMYFYCDNTRGRKRNETV